MKMIWMFTTSFKLKEGDVDHCCWRWRVVGNVHNNCCHRRRRMSASVAFLQESNWFLLGLLGV
jgi:hypothetical protein